jgi:tRNA pseudouridine38-40 synthase
MSKYKLIIAYDGTDYAGWQMQPGLKTVEGILRETFLKIFKKDLSVLAASRTDTGVHALANVVRIEADIVVEPQKLMYALNNILPADIVVREAESAQHFHPFYNLVAKEYHYHIFTRRPLPFLQRYGWFVQLPIDYAKLEKVLRLYSGTYNFSQFCSTDDIREDKVRTIDAVYLSNSTLFPGAQSIVVRGRNFLHTMVRRMVGTAVYVATQPHATVEIVEKMLKEQLKTDYTFKAPAQGLMLHTIEYNQSSDRLSSLR